MGASTMTSYNRVHHAWRNIVRSTHAPSRVSHARTHALIVYIVPCVTPDTTRLPDAPIRNNKVNPNVKMIPEQKPLQTKNPLQWKVELPGVSWEAVFVRVI